VQPRVEGTPVSGPVEGWGSSLAGTLVGWMQAGLLWSVWVFYTKAFVFHLFQQNVVVQDRTLRGIPELRYLYLGALLVLISLAIARYRDVIAAWRRLPLLFWAAGLYVTFSVLWSVNSSETAQRIVHFWSSSLLGVLLFVWFPTPGAISRGLFASLGVVLLASLLLGVLSPENATYVDPNRRTIWVGVFNYKNVLGYMSALTILTLVGIRESVSVLTIPYRVFLGIVALVLLFLSHSAGAQVFLLVTLVSWPFWVWFRRWSVRALLGFSGVVLLFMALALFMAWRSLPTVLAWLGKDATFSSRIPLWGAILWTLQHYGRLWIGMGQEAFFGGWLSPGSRTVWRLIGWHPMQAHNGYMQAVADLGVVGAALFVGLLLVAWVRSFWAYRRDGRWIFGVLYVVFLAFMNLTESLLSAASVYANMALWSLLVWVLVATGHPPTQKERHP